MVEEAQRLSFKAKAAQQLVFDIKAGYFSPGTKSWILVLREVYLA